MLRYILRKTVDTCAPALGRYYREIRAAREADLEARRFKPTAFGFSLAGWPYWADGTWEVNETHVFLKCLEKCPTCIDIGANVGFYSCLAAIRGKHVIAVEPLSANLRLLYGNFAHNGLEDVEVFPLGLSDSPGLRRLYGEARLASFVPGWAEAIETSYSVVPVTTLDVIAAPRYCGIPLTIKMDVEGFEMEVLGGAKMCLALNPKPAWLVEIFLNDRAIPGGLNSRFYETFEVFWRNGYKSRRVDGDQELIEPRDVSRWVATGSVDSRLSNFLFVES